MLPCPHLYHPPCPLCSRHTGFLAHPHTHHLHVQLRAYALSFLLLECSSPAVHMALSLTASGPCSNATSFDGSALATPQEPAVFCLVISHHACHLREYYACTHVFWVVSFQVKGCFGRPEGFACFPFFSGSWNSSWYMADAQPIFVQ